MLVVAMPVGMSVKINELRVPEVIRHGTAALLDCDYTLEDSVDHTGLVVKWFFNDQSRPVYQWIPGAKKPQGLGVLKNKLNLEYRASSDERTMHRALHILHPSAELSGEYTCVVSTFVNEDKQTKRMLVFVPERSLLLRHGKTEDGSPNVACTAEGVFPQPEMTVRMAHEEVESKTVLRREGDGLYDISAVATLPDGAMDVPTEFACELRVPAANYTVRRESVYYPGSSSDGAGPLSQLLFLLVLVRSALCCFFMDPTGCVSIQ